MRFQLNAEMRHAVPFLWATKKYFQFSLELKESVCIYTGSFTHILIYDYDKCFQRINIGLRNQLNISNFENLFLMAYQTK